ncbi:hypothetical protein M422DRAFT_271067 [Sphaerobolus stellatus SS14]|uniref:Uncharacterized protein n=1 Tax=Sphaerobolus stellatus (strain SS14) TaxID=990650 RepID=A0A0C9UQP3_SPHS4|nr:hypothetical protein M422DRAFT_271067 [Sphaerobolus stellatus SS14]
MTFHNLPLMEPSGIFHNLPAPSGIFHNLPAPSICFLSLQQWKLLECSITFQHHNSGYGEMELGYMENIYKEASHTTTSSDAWSLSVPNPLSFHHPLPSFSF